METKTWIAMLVCLATALMLFVIVLSYQRRHLKMARTMIWMMGMASCYSLGYAFEVLSDSLLEVKLAYQLQYLGIPFTSVFWLLVVFLFTGFAPRYRTWITAMLFILPVITFLLHLTNDWHHLVYKAFVSRASGEFPQYMTVKGPWYVVHGVYNYTILLFGILLFIPMYIRAVPIVRKQIVVLIIGAAGPMLFNIGYSFNREIDFTPLGFAVTGLIYAWGIYRFRLFRLTPLAYEKMFDTVRDGVILLDYEDQIVSYNAAAEEAYPELALYKGGGRETLAESPLLLEQLTKGDYKRRFIHEGFRIQRGTSLFFLGRPHAGQQNLLDGEKRIQSL